jgi:hypothetical protein
MSRTAAGIAALTRSDRGVVGLGRFGPGFAMKIANGDFVSYIKT